jgi:hypothetical protein
MSAHPSAVVERLLAEPLPLFAVLDAARDEAVLSLVHRLGLPARSLYAGEAEGAYGAAGPWLVALGRRGPLLPELVGAAWGRAWGVLVASEASFREVRAALRRLVTVRLDDGREVLFRFYDPRILRVILPTADADQLGYFFGEAVEAWLCEAPDGMLRFALQGGALDVRRERWEASGAPHPA